MRRAAALLALVLALVPAAAASGAAPTQTEIESQVMCPVCGTLLQLAESPQAKREKVFIAHLIAEGKSENEIKDALVAEYGDAVLALPKGSGFDLSAYLVPIIGFLVAVAALAFGVVRWRRSSGGSASAAEPPPEPSSEDIARLDADLSRYDL